MNHYWFVGWPDHGIPKSPRQVLHMRNHLRNFIGESNEPIVVHCSAGIGRTGTFVIIDYCIKELVFKGKTSPLSIIKLLREDRFEHGLACDQLSNLLLLFSGGLIQTPEQYEFIQDALVKYSKTLDANSAHDACN